tara:strand:- start:421 stop:2766 length:2346 start_codon:yes stop_codon:yes gene_type:complete
MLENSLAKTHYIGRDGYVWWIGQIPKQKNWIANIAERPTESNDEFKGFDYRYKVRIIGYHPPEVEELSDEDLPWASVLFPVTAGSGQGGASQSPNLRQGMFVHGFFLDGEDGQQPVITGVFGVNQYAEVKRNNGLVGPYELFSGYDSTDQSNNVGRYCIPKNQDQASTDEAVIESTIAQDQEVTGPDIEAKEDDKVPQNQPKGEDCDLSREVPIQTILKNALNRKQRLEKAKKKWKEKISTKVGNVKIDVSGALKDISDLERAIDETMAQAQDDITGEVKRITDAIQKNVNKGVNKAMAKAYSSLPISKLTEAKKKEDKAFDDLSCAFRNIAANLFKMVGKFLNQSINKLINGPICLINNFVGSLLGQISGVIDGAVDSILGPIKSFLSSIGGVNDIVDDLTDVASSAFTFLSCAASPNCSDVQSWSSSEGIVAPDILGTLDVPGIMSKAKNVYSGIKKSIGKFKNIGDSLKGVVDGMDFKDVLDDAKGSCNVGPLKCGPPTIQFFGGGGSGAAGNAIIGAAGTLLGVDIILPGSGYADVPFIGFKDSCGKGGGASGTAVINDGQVVNVIMNETGTGYLPAPDGSQGGDGTTWADPDETTVKRVDGTYDVPYSPGEVIPVFTGDEVTEPGGNVVIIQEPTTITAKSPKDIPSRRDSPSRGDSPTSNTGEYPVILSIDSINVIDGGFNYDLSKDTVVVEPDNGAKLSIGRGDSLGGIITINVDDGGSGFKDDPKIYIQSESGYNVKLVPTFKVTRVDQDDPVRSVRSPADIIQVVDCVGKFS